ncbi:Transposase DDE domain-containing protein [Pseudobutyrivibrio sp. UC1225]|uniref:IS4 family transposase n=1 Tax=Pseudobutyrivibrio sp. UC1225 TaxID=1798185 RepID=UPI0008E4F675|nr:IS4 family transposase [Pseudobutyrivibrio sp. UC1225]SFO20668.1 Transposase DDE domain-containing protein [Pseudobutyrivibrio sp. UC1225]SFO22692.1 Transposase DDE domain-containing protein [Pseudobutyrivibrio sp. UC1225]SFO27477.1 Transposase DDE domain-containing protein [Pseudobutyrivibrio sp. UC1225]SFO35043.1 Transposase DDE domain-containing protein [Pseudobutyrivibrio sp. UC1225]
MKPKNVKKLLFSAIESTTENYTGYVNNTQIDFTRNRKLSFSTIIKAIIGMGSKSITNELIDLFPDVESLPSASAFVQQRQKIKTDAFKSIFNDFTSKLINITDDLVVLAVDGSDIQIPTNPDDKSSFHPGSNGQKPYNLLHLNALYNLENHLYTDAIIQGKMNTNEHSALQEMVDNSSINRALVIADRGYESYNNMAHIQEKGWFFLIRIKDGTTGIKNGLDLPDIPEFDVDINLKLTRKQTKEMKNLFLTDRNHYKLIPHSTPFDYLPLKLKKADEVKFFELNFRIVRFKITEDSYETILTNLEKTEYSPERLKVLYESRWGIETSFRDLKYTIGMLNFHSKKVMCVQQEIYAHLIMYNFAEMITSHVVIDKKQRKYTYKANFSVAAHVCRLFFLEKTTSPNLETIIARNTIPIRPGRHRDRTLTVRVFRGFLYRVA